MESFVSEMTCYVMSGILKSIQSSLPSRVEVVSHWRHYYYRQDVETHEDMTALCDKDGKLKQREVLFTFQALPFDISSLVQQVANNCNMSLVASDHQTRVAMSVGNLQVSTFFHEVLSTTRTHSYSVTGRYCPQPEHTHTQ